MNDGIKNEWGAEALAEWQGLVGERLGAILAAMAEAAARAGRSADACELIAVTKTHPLPLIRLALAAGCAHIGENRVQEAVPKIEALRAQGWGGTAHLIGHLQRNKAKLAAAHFDTIHGIDSEALVLEVEKHAAAGLAARASAARPVGVLVQVNISGEDTKNGCAPGAAVELARVVAAQCPHLRLEGLMTIAPLGTDNEGARPHFAALRELAGRVWADGGVAGAPNVRARPHLSMGMTADYRAAIEEGATFVRVGSAIFGPRE